MRILQKILDLHPARAAAVFAVLTGMSGMAMAHSLFAPAVFVNDAAITNYEVAQRKQLLEVLRTPGDLDKEALQRLISERLQSQAAEQAGIFLSSEEIADGVEEFARRNNQSGAALLGTLEQEGVAPESFRDFVRAGLAWRQLIRARFRSQANISGAEIDRAISMAGTTGSAEVLISEIFLPMNTPENQSLTRQLAPQITRLTTFEQFSDAARRFSAGPSRERGGVVNDWVPLANLPAEIRALLLTMRPGQVTEPITIPNALALFQLRARRETAAVAAPAPVLDYAAYYIAGGRSASALARAAAVQAQIDTCDDLYAVAQNQPANVLDRQELALGAIETDIALELARLDAGEVSTALTRNNGETLVFLMLCSRSRDGDSSASRDDVRERLSGARLSGLADAFLDELRANASIRFP